MSLLDYAGPSCFRAHVYHHLADPYTQLPRLSPIFYGLVLGWNCLTIPYTHCECELLLYDSFRCSPTRILQLTYSHSGSDTHPIPLYWTRTGRS